jgi:hypothetical protein
MTRLLTVLALAGVLLVCLGGAVAQAHKLSKHRSVVVRSLDPKPGLRAYWSVQRMRRAQPAPPLRLAGRPGPPAGRAPNLPPSYVASSLPGAAGGVTAAPGVVPAAADPSAQGTDTGASTVFPNSTNGLVFGSYEGSDYRCSGSVVSTLAGRAVLTAGHCVIDPGPGTRATNLIFVPGYRDGAEPFGEWTATSIATPARWESTAGTGDPYDADEAADMAILTLANRPSDGASVQSQVGAVGMGFNQPRQQTYNQYGYPGEFPYDGSRLYRVTAPWADDDPTFSPPTIGIVSDFTGGSSGGPWLVGAPPVALSVSVYRYILPPLSDSMYGPYFGGLAQQLYAAASATAAAGAVSKKTPPSNRFSVRVLSRDPDRGLALLGVRIPAAGGLALSGVGVRKVRRTALGARLLKVALRARGAKLRSLRERGSERLAVRIAFTPGGGTKETKDRSITLVRRP